MELLRSRRSSAVDQSSEEEKEKSDVDSVIIVESTELVKDQSFWDLKNPLDDLKISVNPPKVEMAIIKRLGEPSWWSYQGRFSDFIRPIYTSVSDSVSKKKE